MSATEPPSQPDFEQPMVFNTTRWTQVISATETRSPEGMGALEQLCRAYWHPLHAFVQRQGFSPEEAHDLTQGFFEQLIEKKVLQTADRERGRFRSFLLGCLKNFLNNHRRNAGTLKRGGGIDFRPMDALESEADHPPLHEPTDGITPETLFEKEWAQTLINRVLDMLRAEYVAAGMKERFDDLSLHLVEPEAATPYAQLVQKLGMTEGSIKMTMHRFRRRYRELFRQEVAALVGSEGDVEDELRHIVRVLAR